jgi:hypothetical protein
MAHVDLLFPVLGTTLPIDHNYLLYGALSKLVPRFHDPNGHLRFTAINGQRGEIISCIVDRKAAEHLFGQLFFRN